MKLVQFHPDRLGVLVGDRSVVDVTEALSHHDPGLQANYWTRMCADFSEVRERITRIAGQTEPVPLTEVTLQAPVLNPSKVIAAASNYDAHVREMRPAETDQATLDVRSFFDVFLKAPSSITGPGATVYLPDVPGPIHYEGELALVIGRAARHVSLDEAMDHVLGYTILLDMTERGKGDRSRRKSYDGFTPIGPVLTTRDEIDDWKDLAITVRLNGEIRQDVRAGEMLRGIPEIISRASEIMTLQPGDVITTGSPPGVGQVLPGDEVEVTVPGIGVLNVTIADGKTIDGR